MDPPKGSSDAEDIPSDFFDDFAKEDFIEGLSVVDEWDTDEPEKSRDDAKDFDAVEDLRDLIDNDRKEEALKQEQERADEQRRKSNSEARMDDFIKPGSRRDPNKTNEAIKRDKELKVKQHIAKHLESSEDLRPPGTELDDFFEESKRNEKNGKNSEGPAERSSPQGMPERNSSRSKSKTQSKKRSLSPVRHRSPGKLQEAAARFYGRPGKYRASPGRLRQSPGRLRQSPGRYRHLPGRFRDQEKHRDFRRHQESPPRLERRMHTNRKSPQFYRHGLPKYEQHHRSRSPYHGSGYRKERRYPSPRASSPRSRRRTSRSPQRYNRSRSRSPRRSSDHMPHKEYISPYPYAMGPKPTYPVPGSYIPGMSVDTTAPPIQYSMPQTQPYYAYPYDINIPQPVPAPIPAPLTPSSQLLEGNTTIPSSNVVPTVDPTDALAKLVADGILSHEDYLKLAPNKGALLQLDAHTKTGVIKRCHSAVSKLDELMPSNRLIIGRKKIETPKAIEPNFFSPLKKKPIAEFKFTETSASAIAIKNKQIIETIVSTLDLYDLVGRPKRNLSNMKDAAVQTTSPHCDKCVIREATLVNEVGTSIDQEHFSSSTHTQVVEQDLQSSKSVFNASGSTSDGSAPISFAHMTPAQLVSQLVARAKTLKQSDGPGDRPPNQYQGRNNYDDRRGPPGYRNNYNQYRY